MTAPETVRSLDHLGALAAEHVLGWKPLEGDAVIEALYPPGSREREDADFMERVHRRRVWIDEDAGRMACDECGTLPAFAEDTGDAWRLVEAMRAKTKIGSMACDLCIKVGVGDFAFCEIFDLSPMGYVGQEDTISAEAKAATAPIAICLAALSAVGHPVRLELEAAPGGRDEEGRSEDA